MSWPHGATRNLGDGINLVHALKCNLSASLHGDILESAPQVVQVWFEPDPRVIPAPAPVPLLPTPLVVLHGGLQFTPQTLAWTTTHTDAALNQALSAGGRILIRIHCGLLVDVQQRPFSAALDAVLGIETLHVPGGVFESWFFIKG